MAKARTGRTWPRLIDELRARLEGPLQRVMSQNESILRLLGPLNVLAAQRDLIRSDFVRRDALNELDRESASERAVTHEGAGRKGSGATGKPEVMDQSATNEGSAFELGRHTPLAETLTLRLEAFERMITRSRSMEQSGVSDSRADEADSEFETRNRKRDSRAQWTGRRLPSNGEWPETSPELLRMAREILSRHDALDRRLDRDLPAEARYAP